MSKKHGQRPWRAQEAQVFELVENYEDPTNPFKVESSPNPSSSEGYFGEQDHLWENEAHEVVDEGWGEEYGWEGVWDDGSEWSESPAPEYHAFDTRFGKGKGKKGKSGKGGMGSKGGKDKGAKGSKGKYGSHPKDGRAYIPSPGAKPCPV